MTAEELWQEFCLEKGIDVDTEYDAWGFCGDDPMADELGRLVLEGKKFGTASLYFEYEEEDEDVPEVGAYSVLLDQYEEAYAVVQNFDVKVEPFGRVSDYHGFSEGEGERDLISWKTIHKEYWKPDYEEYKRTFSEEELVVLEKFTVLYVSREQKLLPEVDPEDLVEECFLIEPNIRYADQIVAYREAMLGGDMSGCLSLRRMPDPQEWVDYAYEWGNPRREREATDIIGTLLMCIRKADDKLVGMIQIHTLPEGNPRWQIGHIGYSVLPTERCKGYAKWMLKKGLNIARYAYHIDKPQVCCETDNEGSRRTILANGGTYLDTVEVPEEGEVLERYEF